MVSTPTGKVNCQSFTSVWLQTETSLVMCRDGEAENADRSVRQSLHSKRTETEWIILWVVKAAMGRDHEQHWPRAPNTPLKTSGGASETAN